MHNILGKWYIHKNNNFNDFLKFTQTPWYQRKIAEHSNIDLEITQNNESSFVKTINSLFYNNKEEIEINGEYNMCDKLKKTTLDRQGYVLFIAEVVRWSLTLVDLVDLVIDYIDLG